MRISIGGVKRYVWDTYFFYFSLPYQTNLEKVSSRHKQVGAKEKTITLDLGCGKTPKNPFDADFLYGVDVDYGVDEKANILPCDLGVQPLPFADNFFDYVTAFDLLEHIPRLVYVNKERSYSFITLMSEIYRVLKPGGIFLSDTPAYPRVSTFSDPTHVNVLTPLTFKLYFCDPYNWALRYGFTGSFKLLEQCWHKENLLSIMSKIPA